MGRKNRKSRSRAYATDECVPCEEPIAHVEARVKTTKRNLKDIVRLSKEEAFDYDVRDEIVGKAYLAVERAKHELKRRKARK